MNNMIENKNKSGIYKIVNKINGKVYIGKTKDFYKRYHQYLHSIKTRNQRKLNNHLLNSFLKYGIANFDFEVVEICDISMTTERELFWMHYFNSCDRNFGYNIRMDSSTGMITHPETSLKISERLKREWCNGLRDLHSDKLKKSWESRDRIAQGELFTKLLTKYIYFVDGQAFTYQDLLKQGLKSVISKFYKNKTDDVMFKGRHIKRIVIDESKT